MLHDIFQQDTDFIKAGQSERYNYTYSFKNEKIQCFLRNKIFLTSLQRNIRIK